MKDVEMMSEISSELREFRIAPPGLSNIICSGPLLEEAEEEELGSARGRDRQSIASLIGTERFSSTESTSREPSCDRWALDGINRLEWVGCLFIGAALC